MINHSNIDGGTGEVRDALSALPRWRTDDTPPRFAVVVGCLHVLPLAGASSVRAARHLCVRWEWIPTMTSCPDWAGGVMGRMCACGCSRSLPFWKHRASRRRVMARRFIHGHSLNLISQRREASTPQATRSPSNQDLYWAAGFIEGEGTFVACFTKSRKTPSKRYAGLCVAAYQVEKEPLERLVAFFGGRVRHTSRVTAGKMRFQHTWAIHGTRALGVAQTLYPLMSTRRQRQIKRAMGLVATHRSPRKIRVPDQSVSI